MNNYNTILGARAINFLEAVDAAHGLKFALSSSKTEKYTAIHIVSNVFPDHVLCTYDIWEERPDILVKAQNCHIPEALYETMPDVIESPEEWNEFLKGLAMYMGVAEDCNMDRELGKLKLEYYVQEMVVGKLYGLAEHAGWFNLNYNFKAVDDVMLKQKVDEANAKAVEMLHKLVDGVNKGKIKDLIISQYRAGDLPDNLKPGNDNGWMAVWIDDAEDNFLLHSTQNGIISNKVRKVLKGTLNNAEVSKVTH